MKPIIAIVGRPNVGKSTLFNKLTRTRDALIAAEPGLTRDRIYGTGRIGETPYIVVDTGGLSSDQGDLSELIAQQSLQAAQEADAIVFMVDGREGLTSADETIADTLRSLNKPLQVAVNKAENLNPDVVVSEFNALGLGSPLAISSAHGQGLSTLINTLLASVPDHDTSEESQEQAGIKIAVIGRPNVGKSTLVNRLLGKERMLVYDKPGTTRDAVAIPFERDQKRYTLIDTAGVRRRSQVSGMIEKFSVIKTLQAIDNANVVIMVIDATETVTDQDTSLLGIILDSGRALIIAVNKWDGLSHDQRQYIKSEVDRKLRFIDFIGIHYISALHGSGVGNLFSSIDEAYESAFIEASTSTLTRLLEEAMAAYPPPLVSGRRIKLRYAHLGGHNPPLVLIHGNQVESVPGSYRRYLERYFREALELEGTPIRIAFKQGENPFKDIKNPLTPRQIAKRRRLLRHVRRPQSTR